MKSVALLIFLLGALASPAFAKDAPKSDVVESNDDQPGLARVLVIGDSVCQGYLPPLADLLKGKANLFRTRKNGGATNRGLERIDDWLAEGKWDVIHFNWGIQDMLANDDGKAQVGPEEYEKNLRTLLAKLQATGAKLIWATITPIPKGCGDIQSYNAIARRVMTEKGVAIDDLFTAMEPHVAEYQLPQNVHYNPEGSAFLAQQVAASIEAALPAKK